MSINKILSSLLFTGLLFAGTALQAQEPAQEATRVVTDEELAAFATTLQGIQQINQDAQATMISELENQGMDVERFNEIQMASQDPNTEVELDEKEIKQFEKVATVIQEIQINTQKEMEGYIEKEGLTMQRYQEILQVVQSDPEQLQRLQELMGG